MSTMVKTGSKPSAANSSKPKRDVTPKLVCMVTGVERFTNKEYLAGKAKTAGSISRFVKHYCSSDAMKLLREGKSVADVRTALKVKPEDIKDLPTVTESMVKVALEINGKRAKAAKPAKGSKKPDTTPKKKAAPKTPKAATTPKPASEPATETAPAPAAPTAQS